MSTDNIAEPSFKEVASATQAEAASPAPAQPAPASPAPQLPEFLNIHQVLGEISKHYERSFKNLSFVPASQLTDGCTVDFIDPQMKVPIASARIRFRNQSIIDQQSGEIFVRAALSDLTFGAAPVSMITPPQQKDVPHSHPHGADGHTH